MATCLLMLAAVIFCHLRAPDGVMLISTSGWPLGPMSERASLTTSPPSGGTPSRVLRTGISSRYSCLLMVVGFRFQSRARVGGRMALASGERRIVFMREVSRRFTPRRPGMVKSLASTPPLAEVAAESAAALVPGLAFLASWAASEVVSPLAAVPVTALIVSAAADLGPAATAACLAASCWSSCTR